MKRGNNIVIIISFIGGSFITYCTLQYHFFEINTRISVVETLLSVVAISVGLYIATSIEKKNNKNQSLHSIVQKKIDNIWNTFYKLDNQLNNQITIELKIATKSFKDIYRELEILKIIFNNFNLNDKSIKKLEQHIGDFNDLITGDLPVIPNNIIELSNNQLNIKNQSTKIHKDIISTLKEANEIL